MSELFAFRVCWRADSNINFKGCTDWEPWEGYEDSVEEIEQALYEGDNATCLALNLVYTHSGFEWWAEVKQWDEVES